MPDGGGQGEQPLRDAGGDPGQAAAAVQLEIELAFECVVDRLDELADRGQQRLAGTGRAVAVGRAEQFDAAVVQVVVEFGGGVAIVGDDQQPRPGVAMSRYFAENYSSEDGNPVVDPRTPV